MCHPVYCLKRPILLYKVKIAKLLNPQWALGATSMFYWAIGILPFKDGFYSSTNPQIGGQTVGPEKNPGA